MVKSKSVSASALSEILYFDLRCYIERSEEFRERRKRFLHTPGSYNLGSHQKFIREKVGTRNLSTNFCSILDNNNEANKASSFSHPKLTIKFEKVDFYFTTQFGTPMTLPLLTHLSRESGIEVVFLSCVFTSDGSINHFINSSIFGTSILLFEDCEFQGVDILAGFDKSSTGNLSFNNCAINNRHVTISKFAIYDTVGMSLGNEDFLISGEEIKKIDGARYYEQRLTEDSMHKRKIGYLGHSDLLDDPRPDIGQRLNKSRDSVDLADLCHILLYDSLKYRVSADQISIHEEGSPTVEISNSQMKMLKFWGNGEFRFSGKNKFSCLVGGGLPSKVYWGSGQDFNRDQENIYKNKKFFLKLKYNAEAQKDTFQLIILQRELAKCEHALYSLEEVKSSFQDRIIFRFSWLVSYYGTSWLRTFLCILFLNLVVFFVFTTSVPASAVVPSCKTPPNSTNSYLELFNPLIRASSHFCVQGWWYTLWDWIHKFLYATLAYELIKTLRRFGRNWIS